MDPADPVSPKFGSHPKKAQTGWKPHPCETREPHTGGTSIKTASCNDGNVFVDVHRPQALYPMAHVITAAHRCGPAAG
jgi:hypothetical protein